MPGLETAGEHPEVPAIPEAEKTDLAEKIQSQFDSVMQNDDAEDEPAAEAEAEVGDKPEPTAEKAEEAEETPAPEAAPAVKAGPTLPAAYIRSLKAMEWTDAEIAEAAKNPAFITTAQKLHATRNKEVAGWAELGRKAKEQQTTQQPAAAAAQPIVLKPVDVKALKAKYGDEALIDELAGPLNAAIAQFQGMLPGVQQMQTRSQQAQLEMLGRQIDGFFAGKDMKPYEEQYGTAKPTEAQLVARTKVLEFADALVGGANQQGRSLSFDEALQMAHDATSGETKTQVARKQITAQLQTRNKGLSLKPGARGSNLNKAGGSRSDLEKRVKSGLAAVLG